ncbi:hypothetical protein IVB69_06550 [Flavobacterium sp. J49]|uniref:hypothetical protein n=1 Tax=Flavobacterium sp. J49 TaxID=2718534 RepID=UPI001594A72D|nr:hypothetical protein [Flavobacterium sp. J49]MBF6641133.1 hypothetical protein [Flavobacterium sp. J49]NIC02380.1 hypothetical protein [Flavobacterium sp. J49]
MRLIATFLFLITIASCTKKEVIQKSDSSVINTDSLKLLKHVDSLRLVKDIDSLKSEDLIKIDLSEFKNKKMRNLNFKLIPIELDGGAIDFAESEEDALFNLTDENYFANWILISKKPKFFVILTEEGFLATLKYNLEKLDAIRFNYINPSSNNHWSFTRQGKIDNKLNILLHHEYSVQVDDDWNFETTTLDKKYYINSEGKIQNR